MKAEIEKLATPFKLTFVEEADEVKKMIEDEYELIKRDIEIKGFRKGNAPRAIAEKQPGFDKFKMYRGIFDRLYTKAVNELKLSVADASDFEVKGPFDDKSPLAVKATIYLAPEVRSFSIKDVSIKWIETVVTDEMVDEQIKAISDKSARYVNVSEEKDYVVKFGDIMYIDFTGRINGKEFDGGSAKAFKYIFGETHFIPGFEEQLAKIKANETAVVSVAFPDDYFSTDLRKKVAEFTVFVRKIEMKESSTIEDVLKINGANSIEELKAATKADLIKDHTQQNEETFTSNLLKACINVAEIDPIPEVLIKWELDNEWNKLLYRLSMTEEEYLKKYPHAKVAFMSQKSEHTAKEIKVNLFLNYIAAQQNFTVTDEEVSAYIAKKVDLMQKTDEEKADITEKLKHKRNYDAVVDTIKHDKATNYLVNVIKNEQNKA